MSDDDNGGAIGELIGVPSAVFWPLVLLLAALGMGFCGGWIS